MIVASEGTDGAIGNDRKIGGELLIPEIEVNGTTCLDELVVRTAQSYAFTKRATMTSKSSSLTRETHSSSRDERLDCCRRPADTAEVAQMEGIAWQKPNRDDQAARPERLQRRQRGERQPW